MFSKLIRSTIVVAVVSLSTLAEARPDQYLSKLYTEGLGRLPDQLGWSGYVNYLSGSCTHQKLEYVGQDILTSTEFNNIGYNNTERLLALYRAVYSREPDYNEFDQWLSVLNSGTTWETVVDDFLSSSEFTSLVPDICNNWYGWRGGDAIDLPTGSTGFSGTQYQLQALLDSTPYGGVVELSERAVVRVSSTLVVPAGVTLRTAGSPGITKYARMGRLVSGSLFQDPIVELESGAKLENVWVDGQRADKWGYVRDQVNILVQGNSTGTTVRRVRSSNSRGWSALLLHGSFEAGQPCNAALIENNLITAYSSSHYDGLWTDGITNACDDSTIRHNQIADASDVAIVVFSTPPGVQSSQVYNNTIHNSGNSSYGALGFDPHFNRSSADFTGSSIHNNTLWNGIVHYDIALYAGTHAWFSNGMIGTGATMKDNTTGQLSVNANTGIGVDGMLDAEVTGNSLYTYLQNVSSCPTANIVASISDGSASGVIQGPYTDTSMDGCMGH